MKTICAVAALIAFPLLVRADIVPEGWVEKPPAPPPPVEPIVAKPTAPGAAEATVRALAIVDSVKPTLMERHVFLIRGHAQQGVHGGYTWTTEGKVIESEPGKGIVQIKLEGTAPASAVFTKDVANFEVKATILELKGKKGAFEIQVVDPDGTVLKTFPWKVG